jgi:prepilin-type N-terminal cleavage/methylation domain-containing protein
MDRIRRAVKSDEGFTLIELLIVIVILGVLAAIVVFAVTGINNKGTTAACQAEKTTLTAAEEAYYAKTATGTAAGAYTDTAGLATGGLLASGTTGHYYTASATGGGTGYTISPVAGSGCP